MFNFQEESSCSVSDCFKMSVSSPFSGLQGSMLWATVGIRGTGVRGSSPRMEAMMPFFKGAPSRHLIKGPDNPTCYQLL